MYAVAAAELDGRPVIISGSDDGTVRVWDLAAGTPIGQPLTGHTGRVWAVAAAELDGRPVIISASVDGTVRAWDLAAGTPIGQPLTGHTGPVYAVAAAELDGRPVIISGGADRAVRIWDLATGTPVGEPFLDALETVTSVAAPTIASFHDAKLISAIISAGDKAMILDFHSPDSDALTQVMAIHTGSEVLTVLRHHPNTVVIGTERGIAVIEIA